MSRKAFLCAGTDPLTGSGFLWPGFRFEVSPRRSSLFHHLIIHLAGMPLNFSESNA